MDNALPPQDFGFTSYYPISHAFNEEQRARNAYTPVDLDWECAIYNAIKHNQNAVLDRLVNGKEAQHLCDTGYDYFEVTLFSIHRYARKLSLKLSGGVNQFSLLLMNKLFECFENDNQVTELLRDALIAGNEYVAVVIEYIWCFPIPVDFQVLKHEEIEAIMKSLLELNRQKGFNKGSKFGFWFAYILRLENAFKEFLEFSKWSDSELLSLFHNEIRFELKTPKLEQEETELQQSNGNSDLRILKLVLDRLSENAEISGCDRLIYRFIMENRLDCFELFWNDKRRWTRDDRSFLNACFEICMPYSNWNDWHSRILGLKEFVESQMSEVTLLDYLA